MKKILIAVMLLAGCALFAFSQNTQRRLAVLPFTGGAVGEGDAIATLFSQDREIMSAFTVLPRTAALNAIFEEHRFQLDGLTDSDTIAGIGHMLNADYVLSGNIRQLGNRNLIVATIIHVESFEQVAGYYHSFQDLGEISGFLPSMSRNMITATQQNTTGLPRLAIIPFDPAPNTGVSKHEADTLAQMLAIDILNVRSHVILPRTSSIETALSEMTFQLQGHTSDEGMAALGRAINADLVLSGTVLKLGDRSMLNAQILNVRDGSLLVGDGVDYTVITDAVYTMPRLAVLLTIPPGRERDRRIAELPVPSSPSRQPRRPASDTPMVNANRNTLEVSGFLSWGGNQTSSVFGFGGGFYWSPVTFTVIGLEGRMAFFTHDEDQYGHRKTEIIGNVSPVAGAVFPIGEIAKIFTSALLEFGSFGPWSGLITSWLTPGFDVGVEVSLDDVVVNIKYRGIWYKNSFVNAIGISWIFRY